MLNQSGSFAPVAESAATEWKTEAGSGQSWLQ
ncbi:hypothetical protein JOF56_011178 [Kibdelosporangium banguiense]|uniref:Uncharacterized protein n=1 Tax=Kibdelosporangium banguiense TaxID=1365924 RepID=A0ABS4U2A8_9PSEU|nr:hypothetical protein [Kibdelosporangium banguiense]